MATEETTPEERAKWRRKDRLARLLPDQVDRIGPRRRDQVTRESVDEVPEGTDPEIIERRKRIARGDYS